ncbi:heteromeric transposase endonuclease subunit TnsA [Acinetobacter haemolyticus]|uniref:heteromeric transposase endonuclease subunit TnsA n=1 Tax=Acinetobacter haemolyticus TaxID=29430 RepID=UPI002A69A7B9|nr:heteromeric transposase endonuclease subunit TnsA [Acinetobacter haemolyticus]WPO67191.1 heteromeric transposase endonuclease subunit TnsA [Acinetobacter haemolyticus]
MRQIGIQTRSMTGVVPDFGQFESSLERDFMELIRFDKNIELYTPQPLVISYIDKDNKKRSYTPDGLVEYRTDILPAKEMKPVLCEIKYRADFRADWKNLMPRFRAAKVFANEQGWDFQVFTEVEIRTPYLKNVRFLSGYLSDSYEIELQETILEKLSDLRESDPQTIMFILFRDKWMRASALPTLWYLIAMKRIGCELSEPLTMNSRIWVLEE